LQGRETGTKERGDLSGHEKRVFCFTSVATSGSRAVTYRTVSSESLVRSARNGTGPVMPRSPLSIGSQTVSAMVTVPHAVNNFMRRNLVKLGEDGFRALAKNIVNNLNPLLHDHEGATPWLRGIQRRYPSQRATQSSMQQLILICARRFQPPGRPRHSQGGCRPRMALSSTRKTQTTKFKWA
jgi:hypothetical protein